MKTKRSFHFVLSALALALVAAPVVADAPRGQQRAAVAYGKLPLSFERNQGQTDGRVRFLSRGDGYGLFLTSNEAVLALRGTSDVLRMKLTGSNPAPKIEGSDPLPGKSNYFIGSDPTKWHTNVSNFERVHYRDVYPGVDVVYYGNQRKLENDFVVAPGTDPGVISLAFGGASKIAIDEGGSLVVSLPSGDVRLEKPVSYQLVAGVRSEVVGSYVVKNGREVGFAVGAYDPKQPLVIDPVLVYSSYLGGNGTEGGNAIAVDFSGNAYVTGTTTSATFPIVLPMDSTLGGGSDAFVTKINAAGTAIVYSTYLGGSNSDLAFDIAVDDIDNVYVTGRTASSNFPTVNAFDATYSGGTDEDAFVAKIDAAGSSLLYSTYLSGTFGSRGWGIAAPGYFGVAYVTGTTSTGFPVTASAFESTNFNSGFLARLCTTCAGASSLVYSTFLAHTGFAEGRAVAADTFGIAYVTGNLNSTTTAFATPGAYQAAYGGGSQDAFVEAFYTFGSGTSSRFFATYLGGSGKDIGGSDGTGNSGRAIAIDASSNIYVVGSTASTNFPLLNPVQAVLGGQNDAFLTKLNLNGSFLIYSTYLGGTGDDFGRSVAVNVAGSPYVTGVAGPNFPVIDTLPTPLAGVGFVTKYTPTGAARNYSTLLSGVTFGTFGIALDYAGNAYVTGSTNGSIVTLNPFQPISGGGGTEGWVSEIADPTILGHVQNEDGYSMAGATVDLSGTPSGTTTTDGNGAYTFGSLNLGNTYTVSVSAPDYTFDSLQEFDIDKNRRADFGPNLVKITGHVTIGASGLDAATVTSSGGKTRVDVTDGSGFYLLYYLPAGRDYTVTPSKAGYTFSPASRSFSDLTADGTADFVATPALGEASPAGNMIASKGAGTSVHLFFTPACGATGHAVYRGTGRIGSGLVWTTSYCGYGTLGSLDFDPGNPTPGSFWYFVVVGQGSTTEGSYGKNSAGVQEPEAIGVGACDRPQSIGPTCP